MSYAGHNSLKDLKTSHTTFDKVLAEELGSMVSLAIKGEQNSRGWNRGETITSKHIHSQS